MLVPACAEVEPDLDIAQSALSCPVQNTDIHRSLVVTLNTGEERKRFSFDRVMTQLRATAGNSIVDSVNANTLLYQQWMRTYGNAAGGCSGPGIDPQGYGLECPRPEEAALASIDPFAPNAAVTFEPIALFNRFDLAPTSGSHCGEYRMVFAKFPNHDGRALFIFEGALPNPTPVLGRAACLPVAQFWQDLSNDPDSESRLAKLEQFFFLGTAVPGFPAVVDAHHYGLPSSTAARGPTPGQIRTNMFVGPEWNLREFKIGWRPCGAQTPGNCGIRFDHVTVKENPADELFRGTHALSPSFRTAFANTVQDLAATNLNTIAMPTANQYNELESVSQRTDVLYANFADTTIVGMIDAQLQALGSPLTSQEVLHRATTQTCAGCHQLSNHRNLGPNNTRVTPPLIWPPSARFVHVNEQTSPIALSEALEKVFLPYRREVLEKFINRHCGYGTQDVADDRPGLTIGGSPEGSPN
ncbi:MAG: hypothetical protein ACTHU0_38785 [Kofleriaceae bacterium]